jgi:hypothetical protein
MKGRFGERSKEAELAGPFRFLLAPDLVQRRSTVAMRTVEPSGRHRNHDWLRGAPAWLSKALSSALATTLGEPRPAFAGLSLNKTYLVPPAGFEPALRP